jgi:hypothetical protein
MTDTNEELTAYNAARQLSKRLLVKNLLEKIASPEFDCVNFSHLLSQEGDGDNDVNPLHGIFHQDTIAHARKFIAASELLEQFYASIPEDPLAPIEAEIHEGVEKTNE